MQVSFTALLVSVVFEFLMMDAQKAASLLEKLKSSEVSSMKIYFYVVFLNIIRMHIYFLCVPTHSIFHLFLFIFEQVLIERRLRWVKRKLQVRRLVDSLNFSALVL